MLAESGVEERFLVEAASTAVYLVNHSPSSAIEYKLPEELWSGSKPGLKHLRRFGCAAYIPKVLRQVLERLKDFL